MAENSNIEWTDHTGNLWWGCLKVHTGCKNCYAEYFSDVRYGKNLWGKKGSRQRIESFYKYLNKFQKEASAQNILAKVFCGSMMDIFEDDKPLQNPNKQFKTTKDLREDLFSRISNGLYQNLVFLFLTKRPENIINNIPNEWIENTPKNVWFGTSISNQSTADQFVIDLSILNGKNLFLSIEPQIDIIQNLDLSSVKWVIQGGESGINKRPFKIEWAYIIKEMCAKEDIPYFFKQIDKKQPIPTDLFIRQFPNF